jgi:hypothetical protein
MFDNLKIEVNCSEWDSFYKFWTNHDSTFISRIEYSYIIFENKKVSEKMLINFCDNSIVEYSPNGMGIDFNMQDFFIEFIQSKSVGKFWHKRIKGILQWKRIK